MTASPSPQKVDSLAHPSLRLTPTNSTRSRKRTKKGKQFDKTKSSPLKKVRFTSPQIAEDEAAPVPTSVPAVHTAPSPSASNYYFQPYEYTMTENTKPVALEGAANVPGKPYYDQQVAALKKAVSMKAQLENKLQRNRDAIYQKEGDYLENTPNGNIILGFENYTKGTGVGAGASRRRGNIAENSRIFTMSDVTYNPNVESPAPSSSSTPIHTAPTPVATGSFLKGESASNHATPTSATSTSKNGLGGKKNKKAAGDDSETDTREVKKARTGAGTARK